MVFDGETAKVGGDAAFRWLLSRHDDGVPVDRKKFETEFGIDAANDALRRWQKYVEVDRTIRRLILDGRQVLFSSESSMDMASDSKVLAETTSFAESLNQSTRPSFVSRSQTQFPIEYGKFTLVNQLGRGAFGSVFLAEDTQLQRQVALKIPHPHRIGDRDNVERFFREARSAANLNHRAIVPVYEVGQTKGHLFIASQYINGRSLRSYLHQRKILSETEAAEIIAELAFALNHAHTRGIIHRDVKPENVMMTEDNRPMLMDFGLAQRRKGETLQTQVGLQMGTPSYMSPEQAAGNSHLADARSDMWALGVINLESSVKNLHA